MPALYPRNIPPQSKSHMVSYQSTIMLPPSNINQNVYIAEIQGNNRIPEKREEVWRSAKKMPFEMATREINLKISDVNPRR